MQSVDNVSRIGNKMTSKQGRRGSVLNHPHAERWFVLIYLPTWKRGLVLGMKREHSLGEERFDSRGMQISLFQKVPHPSHHLGGLPLGQ